MKITCEPTTEDVSYYSKIELNHPLDHLGLDTWIKYFKIILHHWGYQAQTIEDIFSGGKTDEEFFDKECSKGGKHTPEIIGDTFTFRCGKCGKIESKK